MSYTVEKIRGIYAITPDGPIDLDQIRKTISQYNISILQYRRKTADGALKLIETTKLRQLCLQHHTLFIINDDINLAQKVNADGVHLGKNDSSIQAAKNLLGDDAIIGISCYNDINLAKSAQHQGASYVAFGALFASSTKPDAPTCSLDVITQAKTVIDIPIVGIGGIDFDNQEQALKAGCDAVAMINAIFQ
ncbi:Thiamin-phosphate pyrophosphorylase (EC 2.5.1.3) [uncultured Gammaproteobacteria bacterium]|nr:thiamine phosphate synthase [Bathymodiolus heckerae thiotrophic gill symbiont]CAC9581956.1 Thiamin-phosphate pyrophosphorylase (EC 2.5.1.3) [uncultured Gammaproteobacteria bacterium]CAC9605492.1 Thiamin-phosphate pyrophosphorylase (EC 2.5.1.3) [uncultured Gammaproteobacteria bacterium]CAC9951418.1 Thiamin-phosphate pyrophosphorylase (EC 2.5.1.3) [uncultured Gammaproteobacteria bacterium]SHN91444.1 Thiamin-phosphate pyrophosphorylase [Bathymodiolus heckerae thiotrophic gill symbiont]